MARACSGNGELDIGYVCRRHHYKHHRASDGSSEYGGGGGSVKIKLKIESKIESEIKLISAIIMMKIRLKSINFEKLQRFSAHSTKYEKIEIQAN